MHIARLLALGGTSALLVATLGCASDVSAPLNRGQIEQDRLIVINDVQALAARLLERRRDLPLHTGESASSARASASVAPNVQMSFREHAEALPPVVDRRSLQATHAVFADGMAYVAYALAGDDAAGAVDVFDVRNAASPRLVSHGTFLRTDIHTLAVSNGRLYLGTGSQDQEQGENAVLEVITLKAGLLTSESLRVPLPSQVVTGIAVTSGRLWLTTGTGGKREGGVTVLDEATLRPLMFDEFSDARAVAPNGNTVMAVVRGTPGRVRLYDPSSMTLLREFEVDGLSMAGGKASIASRATWSFVGAADGGVQVLQLRQNGRVTGTVVGSVARPAQSGLPSEYAVTNAVAHAGDFLIAANGGAGVWVTHTTDQTTAQTNRPQLTPVGRLGLPDGFSANFVATNYPMLFVAAGNGGLRLIEMRTVTSSAP